MNGFKLYQIYKGKEIHYKNFYKEGDEDLILELTLSYPDNDIWGDNIYDTFYGGNVYYKKIYLHRDDWAEIKEYTDFSVAINDFDNAIDEFKNVNDKYNFKNEINNYLINKAEKIINKLNKKIIN